MLKPGILCSLLLLSGCNPNNQSAAESILTLQLRFNGEALGCDRLINLADTPWSLSQLQLYLSDFQINNKPVLLDPTMTYQQPQLALLGMVCSEPDNANWQLKFTRPLTAGQMSFNIGVPEQRNHQNPLQAKTPLNQSDMYWSWQQGYKYLRLELAKETEQWALHLGAAGCHSASPMRAPQAPCQHQNRPKISLRYRGEKTLILDLAPMLADITLSADNHCMSYPNRLSCQILLPRLGIGGDAQGWSLQ